MNFIKVKINTKLYNPWRTDRGLRSLSHKDNKLNNRNRLWFASVLLLFFVFFNAFAQGTYYPDGIGNTWRFQSVNKVNKKTIKIVEPDTNFGISGVKVLIDETNDSTTQFFIQSTPKGFVIHRAVFDEVALVGKVIFNYKPPQIFIPNPLKLEAQWTVKSKAKVKVLFLEMVIEAIYDQKVVAIEDVTIPAGKFRNCLKIIQHMMLEVVDSESEGTLWLAPNVGPVKMISKPVGGKDEPKIYYLVEYDIKVEEDSIGVNRSDKLTALWARMKK